MRYILLSLALILSASLFAQELKDNQYEGSVIDNKNKTRTGIIEIPNAHLPWAWQKKIKFIETDNVSETLSKKKVKFKKFKAKDLKGYVIGDKIYKTIEYKDYRGANKASDQNTINKFSAIGKAMGKTKYFAEQYREGAISVYKFYTAPPGFSITAGDQDANNHAQYIEDAKTNYDILLQRDDNKAKAFNDMNVKKYFKDCDYVLEKFNNKEYTKKPVKGLKTMISNAFLYGEALKEAAFEMIDDYEKECVDQ